MSPDAATTNTIKCTLSQPINKNTTGIHTQGLCISMFVARAQTWSCKILQSTHAHKPHITWPGQPKYKTEIKNKVILVFHVCNDFI